MLYWELKRNWVSDMEWISVEDRLPDCVLKGMSTIKNTDWLLIYTGIWEKGYMNSTGDWFDRNHRQVLEPVTHWMPAPKSPNE